MDFIQNYHFTIFQKIRNFLGFTNPDTDVFGFCGVFWYHSNSVKNREGTKRGPILYESVILTILCVVYCWKK